MHGEAEAEKISTFFMAFSPLISLSFHFPLLTFPPSFHTPQIRISSQSIVWFLGKPGFLGKFTAPEFFLVDFTMQTCIFFRFDYSLGMFASFQKELIFNLLNFEN